MLNLIITHTDTQAQVRLTENDLADLIHQLTRAEALNTRHDATLYIWHGKLAPSPVLELRDIHGKKGRMML